MASKSGYAQRGSAIIYIFIGVALFGALMFMFSRGASQQSTGMMAVKDKITAEEIASYGRTVERAVNKLLLKGCSESDLRFYHPDFNGASDYAGQAEYSDSNQNQCFVFVPTAGGVKWRLPPKDIVDAGYANYLFTGKVGVEDLGGNNCPDTELIMFLRVTRNVCISYNNLFEVTNTGGNPPQFQNGQGWDVANYLKFGWGGYYGCGSTLGSSGHTPRASELISKPSGCFQAVDGTDVYLAYHVLLAR